MPSETQSTINERLKFLIDKLGMSIRGFSTALGVSDTNTRNYIDRGSKPNSEYLEKLLRRFDDINPAWLLLGEGEPFRNGIEPPTSPTTIEGKKNKGIQSTGNGTNNITLDSCKRELASAHDKIMLLTSQLADKERIIQLLERSGK